MPIRTTGPAAGRALASASAPRVTLEANQAYLPALLKLLDGAKKSVDIIQYNFFSESGSSKQVADKLIALKKKNPSLAVRLYIEGDHGDGAARNAVTMALLKKAGVEVIADGKKLITHAKAVCVDGQTVLAGSHNLSSTSMTRNNETSLLIASPQLAKAFQGYLAKLIARPDALASSTTAVGNVTMVTDGAYYDRLISMVSGAKKSLDASMYYFSGSARDRKADALLTALADAAKRGVKVRLMLETNDGKFAPFINKADAVTVKRLKAAGVDVRLDDRAQISHQKFIVRDGKEVLLGSTNWSTDDFDQRHQLNWQVQSAPLAGRLSTLLATELAAVPR